MTRYENSTLEHLAHRPGHDGDRNEARTPTRGLSRRSLLKRLGVVGAVITTAGAGAVSVRAAEIGVFTAVPERPTTSGATTSTCTEH